MVYPRIVSTDLNDLTCKTPLVVAVSGLTAQRSTSSAWKRSVWGMVRPKACAKHGQDVLYLSKPRHNFVYPSAELSRLAGMV
jgi:hypothetical protein